MPTLFVDITFAVISNGARSGTIHETVEMSEELYDAFVQDTTTSRGGYNLANWIKNNLAYKVIPLGYNHWEVVSPTVRRSNKEMPKARVVSLDRQSNQKKSGIQTFDKPKVNYFARVLKYPCGLKLD